MTVSGSSSTGRKLGVTVSLLQSIGKNRLALIRAITDLGTGPFSITDASPGRSPVLLTTTSRTGHCNVPCGLITPRNGPKRQVYRLTRRQRVSLVVLNSPSHQPAVTGKLPSLSGMLNRSLASFIQICTPYPLLLAHVDD